MKRATSASRSDAVCASSCAEAAICCVDADVCCVEALTCSPDAEDSSATEGQQQGVLGNPPVEGADDADLHGHPQQAHEQGGDQASFHRVNRQREEVIESTNTLESRFSSFAQSLNR